MEKAESNNVEINLLIVSYFTGSITEDDLARLKQWLSASDENRRHFNKLRDSWILSGVNQSVSSIQIEESWNKFKINLSGIPFIRQKDEEPRILRYLKLAASWLLIFGLGSALTWWLLVRPKEKIPAIASRSIEVYTPLGARSMIRLADSTQIWLNAGTKITYGEDYGQKTRSMRLIGEAYFKVAKDSLHPFIVKTEGIEIRALGTRFNVKAYPEEKTISATLEEGKIDIRTLNMTEKDDRLLLNPKEKLIYHKETRETDKYTESPEEKILPVGKTIKIKDVNILSNVRTELYTSWKDSRWIIYREPLSTLAPMLERRFNIKIFFGDEQLKNLKFSGIIENETVDQIVSALKLTAPIDYRINKDTLMLSIDTRATEGFKKIMINNN